MGIPRVRNYLGVEDNNTLVKRQDVTMKKLVQARKKLGRQL